MSNLQKHLSFVKEQYEFHIRMAERFSHTPHRQTLHLATAQEFLDLADALTETEKEIEELSQRPKVHSSPLSPLSITMQDLEGLPGQLIKELSISDSDLIEFMIYDLADENGGKISLDQLLIGLYKKTGEVHRRASITSRLYRMGQKGMIFGVAGKKGVYSTTQPIEE